MSRANKRKTSSGRRLQLGSGEKKKNEKGVVGLVSMELPRNGMFEMAGKGWKNKREKGGGKGLKGYRYRRAWGEVQSFERSEE